MTVKAEGRAPTVDQLRVVDLRAENCVDLLGTEAAAPRLSWRIEAAGRNVAQASYRIRAGRDPTRADLWDSGDIVSDATFDIPWGPPLASMQRVWWTVEITDTEGRTARSEAAWFETGLVSPDDWRAEWIEVEDEATRADRAAGVQWIWSEEPLDPRPHAFRLDFEAAPDLERAEILVAGKDDLRGIWINGRRSSLPRHLYWGTMLPFEGEVRPGRNSLCVEVTAQTSGFFPVDGGAMAALVRLHRKDGTIERIATGPGWRVMAEPPTGWTDPDFEADDWPAARHSGSRAANDPRPGEPALLVRKSFTPRGRVIGARLYATALGVYEARINGSPVSPARLAPEISVFKDHLLYQVYDVTPLIGTGENVVGAIVADGWYAGAFGWRLERYGFGPAPRRLLAQLRLDYEDGSNEWIVTGPDWQVHRAPIVQADIYCGEIVDARLDVPGWDQPGFDASNWAAAKVGRAPEAKLVTQTSPPIAEAMTLWPVELTEPKPGRFVFDFGQNFAGWARIRAKGPSGTTIIARFAELLGPDGTVDQANLRNAAATDRFTLRGDEDGETFEPRFTYHGFRYVEIENYPGIPDRDDVEAVVAHSACRETGTMQFKQPLLQQVWRNTLWSQRSNFFAVPTDCPQRDERMGWTGDIQIFLDAAAFNMEVDPFIRRFLHEMRAAQTPDGGYPIVVPQPLSFPEVVTAGWSEAGIILPWGLWQRYGDTAVIDENWQAMEKWMRFVGSRNPDHVWRNERGLDLGDWLSVDAIKPDDETTPRMLCATAYWAYCAGLMAEMAEATGRSADAARYRDLRSRIGEAYAAEFVQADGTCGNGSQTSQVLSLHFGLVPEGLRRAAAEVLAADIRRRGMTLSTGFLGTPYLLDTLADNGQHEVVAALLLQTEYPSWGYMPRKGATTIWERWNSDVGDLSMNSYNHYALGAVVGFFYRRLAGIAPATPGFRRIAVHPYWLPQIGRVAARYESCVGMIATEVDGDAGGISSLVLTVPPNAVAEVELPARGDWRESGRSLDDRPDIRGLRRKGGFLRLEVGSGEYRFALGGRQGA